MTQSRFSLRAAGALFALSLSAVSAARAHVTLEWPAALAGTSYKASFRITHGCGASPTRQVVVEVPAGVRGARPMPHAGWSVEIQRAPLARPHTSHGRTVTEDVARITWTARTPADMLGPDQFDEFVLLAQLPDAAGTLWWPVRQVCAEGRLDWVQVPGPGQNASDLKSPAVPLEILPSGDAGDHKH
jgi:uncharacterized protein YcnI